MYRNKIIRNSEATIRYEIGAKIRSPVRLIMESISTVVMASEIQFLAGLTTLNVVMLGAVLTVAWRKRMYSA